MTTLATKAASQPAPARRAESIGRSARRPLLATLLLLGGALYCLVPVAWVIIASTKSNSELFTTFTFAPGTSLGDNLVDLFAYGDGQFLLRSEERRVGTRGRSAGE